MKRNLKKSGKTLIIIALAIPVVMGWPFRILATEDHIQPNLIKQNSEKIDPPLFMSMESILKRSGEKNRITLIDVRSAGEFSRFRIPGSINIPLYSIKTKAFLRHKNIVLVNEGCNSSLLEKECRELRAAGYRIFILNGGLNYWKQNDGILEGDPFAIQELNKLQAKDFFQEKDDEKRMIINASLFKPESESLIPHAVHIPFSGDPEKLNLFGKSLSAKFTEKYESARTALVSQEQIPSVIIFNETGAGYESIQKAVEKTGVKNVFYLKGGLKAYGLFLRDLSSLRTPKEERIKKTEGCKNCNNKSGANPL